MMESVAEVTNFGTADVQRCVIVRKDEKGYGLTVSGDNPVRIQSLKYGGAASRAGVQEGDIIIKVNGSLVTSSNHAEVVKLIKAAGAHVALTLLGKHQGPSPVPPGQAPFTPQLMDESKRGQITAPTPASEELTQYYSDERMETLSRYLESEKQTFIQIQDSYNDSPSEKLKKDLASTRNRIKVLESQIAKENQRMRAMPTIQEPHSDTLNENVPSHQTDRRGSDRGLRGNHYRQRSSPDQELYSQIPAQEVTRGSSQVKRNRSDVQDRGRDKKGPRRDNAIRHNNTKRASKDVEMTRAQTLPGDPDHEDDADDARLRSSTVGVMEDMGGGGGRNLDMNLFNPAPSNPMGDMFAPAANQKRSTDIMTMEDEFPSDQEMPAHIAGEPFDEHGPFDRLEELEKKPAHLAVFLHYLISNKDPSSLFFYLVIESFKVGTPKDMKKWSYEIFSTFIADNSPMKVESITKDTANVIESDMVSTSLPDDKLRTLFVRAQGQAVVEVVDLLAEFRRNRSLGLGTLFGEQQLTQENMEKSQEIKIAEQILMPHLDRLMDIRAKREDKNIALAAALSTFMRQIGVKVSGNSSLERCPSFATKEKKGRTRTTKKHVKGHQFQEKHYTSTAFCHVCNGLLWGIGNQGLCCQDCELNLHRNDVCIERLADQCPGKSGRKARASGIRGMIPAKVQNLKPSNLKGGKGEEPEKQMVTSPGGTHQTIVERLEEENEEIETIKTHGRVLNLITQFGSSGPPEGSGFSPHSGDEFAPISPGERGQKVQRSSSLKNDRERRNHRGRSGDRRSKSEYPDQDRSKDDVDMDPSLVGQAIQGGDPGSQSSLSEKSQESISSIPEARTYIDDSDMEAEQDTPNWQGKVDKDIVKKLKPKEVKRQEIINELFHTERTHVRLLKVLDKVFYQPMLSEGVLPRETVMHLFPNLPELIEEHSILNSRMKKERKTSQVIQDVGNLLIERFDGEAGKRMKEVSADFCINQRHCLEMIKSKQRKEAKLNGFITEAEADPLCRRLPLRGIISTQMQRLTKYPLFIQQLLKYSQPKTEENTRLERALKCVKDLLDHVNQAVREADNRHRLVEIRSKTDLSPYERTTKGNPDEVNTSQIFHKLLYDSPITWKLSRNKTLDMHAMLLEEYVILMQKQDDKFILKFHSTSNIAPIDQNATPNSKRNTHSPIIKLSTTLFREVATSKKAFFLISTSQQGPQIYELQAPSSNEKKLWMELIRSAQDNVKRRNSGRGVNPMNLPQRPDYHHDLDSTKQEGNSVNPSVERAERNKVVTKTPEVVTQVPFTAAPVVEEQGDAATLLRKALDEPVASDADSKKSTKYILLLMQRVMRLNREQGSDQLILDALERCHSEVQRVQTLHLKEIRSVDDDIREEQQTVARQALEIKGLRQELDKRVVGGTIPSATEIVTDLDRNRLSYSADSNSSATDESEGPEHDYEQVAEIAADLRAGGDSGDSSENTLRPIKAHRLEPVQTQVATEVAAGQIYDLREAERTARNLHDSGGVMRDNGQLGGASCIQEDDGVMTLTTSRIESMQLTGDGPENVGEGESPYMTLAEAHTGTTCSDSWDHDDRRTSLEGYEKVEEFVPPLTSPVQAETIGAAAGFGSTGESLSSYTDEASSGGDIAAQSALQSLGRPDGVGANGDKDGSVPEGAKLKDSKPDSVTSTSSSGSNSSSSRPNSMVSADSGSEEARADNSSNVDGKDSEESEDRTLQVKPAEVVIPGLVDEGADQQPPPSPSSSVDSSRVRKSLVLSDSLDDPGTDVDNPMLGERLLIVESMSDLSVASDHTSGDCASMDLTVREDSGHLEDRGDSARPNGEDKVKQMLEENTDDMAGPTPKNRDSMDLTVREDPGQLGDEDSAGPNGQDMVKQMLEENTEDMESTADHQAGQKSEDIESHKSEEYIRDTDTPRQLEERGDLAGPNGEEEVKHMLEENTGDMGSTADNQASQKSEDIESQVSEEHIRDTEIPGQLKEDFPGPNGEEDTEDTGSTADHQTGLQSQDREPLKEDHPAGLMTEDKIKDDTGNTKEKAENYESQRSGDTVTQMQQEDNTNTGNKTDHSVGSVTEDKVEEMSEKDTVEKVETSAGQTSEDKVMQILETSNGNIENEVDHLSGLATNDVVKEVPEADNLDLLVRPAEDEQVKQVLEEDTECLENRADCLAFPKNENLVKEESDKKQTLSVSNGQKGEEQHKEEMEGHIGEDKEIAYGNDNPEQGKEPALPGSNVGVEEEKDHLEEGEGREEAEDNNDLEQSLPQVEEQDREAVANKQKEESSKGGIEEGKITGEDMQKRGVTYGRVEANVEQMTGGDESHSGSEGTSAVTGIDNDVQVDSKEHVVQQAGVDHLCSGSDRKLEEETQQGGNNTALLEGVEGMNEVIEDDFSDTGKSKSLSEERQDHKMEVNENEESKEETKHTDDVNCGTEIPSIAKESNQSGIREDSSCAPEEIEMGEVNRAEGPEGMAKEGPSQGDRTIEQELDDTEKLAETEEKGMRGADGGGNAEALHDDLNKIISGKDSLQTSPEEDTITDGNNKDQGDVNHIEKTEKTEVEDAAGDCTSPEDSPPDPSDGGGTGCSKGVSIPETLSEGLVSEGKPSETGDAGTSRVEDIDSKETLSGEPVSDDTTFSPEEGNTSGKVDVGTSQIEDGDHKRTVKPEHVVETPLGELVPDDGATEEGRQLETVDVGTTRTEDMENRDTGIQEQLLQPSGEMVSDDATFIPGEGKPPETDDVGNTQREDMDSNQTVPQEHPRSGTPPGELVPDESTFGPDNEKTSQNGGAGTSQIEGTDSNDNVIQEPLPLGETPSGELVSDGAGDLEEHPRETGGAGSETSLAVKDLNRNISDSEGERSIPSGALKVEEGDDDESEGSSCPPPLDDLLLLTESSVVPNVNSTSFEYDSDSIDGCEELV